MDAEVIAVDVEGQPALLRRRVGAGAMVLATYPLEYFAAESAHVNPEPTSAIYAALAREAGIEPTVTVADPHVMCDVLIHEDGTRYAWFISQSDHTLDVTPACHEELRDLDSRPVPQLRIPPFGVVVAQLGQE